MEVGMVWGLNRVRVPGVPGRLSRVLKAKKGFWEKEWGMEFGGWFFALKEIWVRKGLLGLCLGRRT